MKTRIITPFVVSVIAFIFAYLFWRGGENYIVLLFIGIGMVLAGFGVYSRHVTKLYHALLRVSA